MTTTIKRGRPRIHKDGGQLLAVYLPRELVDWVKARAKRLGVPVSQIVAEAIEGRWSCSDDAGLASADVHP